MNKKLLIAPAAVAAVLLFAGCTPSTPAEESPAPSDMMSSMPEATPSETMPTDMGDGMVDPSTVDSAIMMTGTDTPSLPVDFPTGIPVYAENVVPGSAMMMEDGGYMVAFSGSAEDVTKLIDAFKANGFIVSGTDTSVVAAKTEYNIIIKSDPADLPSGAAYSYTVYPN
jgi:hypothetical protein